MVSHLDLSDTQIDILAELYAECDTTLDDLPYPDAFERLSTQFPSLVPVCHLIATVCGVR